MPFAARDFDCAAMLHDDLLNRSETDAPSVDLADHIGAAMEPLEHMGQVGGWYADSLVGDAYNRHFALNTQYDRHVAAVRTVLDRISDQIVERPLQPRPIPFANQRVQAGLKEDPMRVAAPGMCLGNPANKRDQIDRAAIERWRIIPPHPRRLEEIVEHTDKGARARLDARGRFS